MSILYYIILFSSIKFSISQYTRHGSQKIGNAWGLSRRSGGQQVYPLGSAEGARDETGTQTYCHSKRKSVNVGFFDLLTSAFNFKSRSDGLPGQLQDQDKTIWVQRKSWNDMDCLLNFWGLVVGMVGLGFFTNSKNSCGEIFWCKQNYNKDHRNKEPVSNILIVTE